jgi:RNA polymerase sigma-70 factor (ECF subfamily)
LYEYARRKGHRETEASDLAQGFFAELLDKNFLQRADQDRGRFRTFLLTAFQRYLCNDFDRKQSLKRGGGIQLISLDADQSELNLQNQITETLTPEAIFERRWAMTLLSRVLDLLRNEMSERGRADVFEKCRDCLLGEPSQSYCAIAESLCMTESAVKVTVHRMRQRYRELLLQEVSQTLTNADDLDDEIQHLLKVVQG